MPALESSPSHLGLLPAVGVLLPASLSLYVLAAPRFGLDVLLFHGLYVGFVILSSYVVVSYAGQRVAYLYFALSILFLRLLTQLRTPATLLAGPDSNYELQIIGGMLSGAPLWSFGVTGPAQTYQLYPGLEVFVTAVSTGTGLDATLLLKFTGVALGLLTFAFLERFYRTLFENRHLATIAAFFVITSSWMVAFDTFTVHQTLALVFFSMFLWASTKRGWTWRLTTILSLSMVVVSHHLTTLLLGLYLLIVGLLVLVLSRAFSRSPKNPHGLMPIVLILGLATLWTIFVATDFVRILGVILGDILQSPTSSGYTLVPFFPTGMKHPAIVAVTALGFGVFGCAAAIRIVSVLRSKDPEPRELLGIAVGTAGIVIFVLFMGIWFMGYSRALDLRWRGLIYLFAFTSPVFVLFLMRLRQRLRSSWPRVAGTVTMLFVVSLVLVPSVYHGVSPAVYDMSSELSDDDPRLSPEQWRDLGTHVKVVIDDGSVYGVRLAFVYVGSFGRKFVLPVEGSFPSWETSHDDATLFLRRSLSAVPDSDLPSMSLVQYLSLLERGEVLITTGEVVGFRIRTGG